MGFDGKGGKGFSLCLRRGDFIQGGGGGGEREGEGEREGGKVPDNLLEAFLGDLLSLEREGRREFGLGRVLGEEGEGTSIHEQSLAGRSF